MRILTRTQYDAICDIVKDLQKENEDLKRENAALNVKLANKGVTIDYLNDKLFKRTEQLMKFQGYCKSQGFLFLLIPEHKFFDLDFPATTKQPEDKLF